jgi:hypothetical protein
VSPNKAPQQRRTSASLRSAIGERFAAWVVTAPVGRFVAFFADLAVYWWRWARGRQADSRDR